MITSEDFDKIIYHKANDKYPGVDIISIIGMDSEAITSGKPFIFCFSDNKYIDLRDKNFNDLLNFLYENYIDENIGVYNLKYESGAFLYLLSKEDKIKIWDKGKSIIKFTKGKKNYNLKISYIPHKCLKFEFSKKEKIVVWDIFPFYKSSLNSAAKKYLQKEKIDIETKSFTLEYVKENFQKIKTYCMQDAKLTAELGNFLIKKVVDFGLRVTALYSPASFSLRYFMDNSNLTDINRFFKNYKPLLRYAIDSYQGGKFEITARGIFTGYEYDIISAYPAEIYNLLDFSYCKVIFSNDYQPHCQYGFIRVHIKSYDSTISLPFGLMPEYTRIYGIGEYYTTITKAEYDYLIELKIEVKIISGYWLFMEKEVFPYRKAIDKLMELKFIYKNKDEFLYNLVKICMNSFYGKMCQLIEDRETGKLKAGIAFNPIHAAIITANTRIKVTRLQNELKEKCLAVHTDSVITTDKISNDLIGKKLGNFELVVSGTGIIVSCGCYQIEKIIKTKGFSLTKGESWFSVLEKNKNKKSIPYTQLRVESFSESTAKGHFEKLNYFEIHDKNMSLNADTKRVWSKNEMYGRDYLKKLYTSENRVIFNPLKPSYWSDKNEQN